MSAKSGKIRIHEFIMIINKQVIKKIKLILATKSQLINVEGMKEVKNHHNNNGFS